MKESLHGITTRQIHERAQELRHARLDRRWNNRPAGPRSITIGACRGGASTGLANSQHDLAYRRLANLYVQDRLQLVTQHVELMQPDGILDAEVQASTPEVLHTRSLFDVTCYGPVPGSKEREVMDHPTETQPLQAALDDICAPGRGGLRSPL